MPPLHKTRSCNSLAEVCHAGIDCPAPNEYHPWVNGSAVWHLRIPRLN